MLVRNQVKFPKPDFKWYAALKTPTYIEKILSTALHVNVVALKTLNTSFSHTHCMQKVEKSINTIENYSIKQLLYLYME